MINNKNALSNFINKLSQVYDQPIERNKLLDVVPNHYIINNMITYDISTKNMTVDVITVEGYNFLICTPMYISSIFLFYSFVKDDIYNYLYLEADRYSYLTISSFDSHNLNDEQLWYLDKLYNAKDENELELDRISKPKKMYLKRNNCTLKADSFDISKSYIYNIS